MTRSRTFASAIDWLQVVAPRHVVHLVRAGGLMVQLLEAERGVVSGFTTGDVDVVLDVRAATGATEQAAASLLEVRFEPEPHDDDLTYRFVRGHDVVDLLAPDHLGTRTSILTVPPASTLAELGSRQALMILWSARVLRMLDATRVVGQLRSRLAPWMRRSSSLPATMTVIAGLCRGITRLGCTGRCVGERHCWQQRRKELQPCL